VDGDKLDDTSDVTCYAAILAALAATAPTLGEAGRALQPQFEAWWSEVLTSNRAPIARRRVEQALDALFQGPAKRVILLFDDCDALIAGAPLALFRSLRALRDDHKYQLAYVTVTRRELARLREPSPDFESFFELLAPHMLALRPYQELDAYQMLRRLVARNEGTRPFAMEELRSLYQVTGGHAGLLRVAFEAVKNTDRARGSDLLDFLAAKRVVYDESQKIWDSLEENEHDDLLALAQGTTPAGEGLPPLRKKGIVVQDEARELNVFAPLFKRFVEAQLPDFAGDGAQGGEMAEPASAAMSHDPATGRVTLGDRTIPLPPVESDLFGYLLAHCDRACELDELVTLLMAIDPGGSPYSRLQQHLVRLRDRVNTPQAAVVVQNANGSWQVKCGV
jgi:hypothetical protein